MVVKVDQFVWVYTFNWVFLSHDRTFFSKKGVCEHVHKYEHILNHHTLTKMCVVYKSEHSM